MISTNNHIDKSKIAFHSLFVNIDKVNKFIHKNNNKQQKKQTSSSKTKKVCAQIKPSSQIKITKCQNTKKKTQIILNKADMFKHVKKQSDIFTNKLQISNQSSNMSIKSGKTEKTNISRSNSISNLDPSTDATITTTTSKRIIKDLNSNLIAKSKNQHCLYLSTDLCDSKKKEKPKQNKFIPFKKEKLSIDLIYNNNAKQKKRQKNKSMTINSNFLNTNTIKEGSLSLLSEDSIFNLSKHRSTSNTHNDSGSNKISMKHSSKSNSLDKKNKSTSIDFTYSDDEVLSNRKKCKQLIMKNFEKQEQNKHKQQMNNKNNTNKKESLDFESFCNALNERLFGIKD